MLSEGNRDMEQKLKIALLVIADLFVLTISPWIALYIRLEGNTNDPFFSVMKVTLPAMVGMAMVIFYCFGLYKRLWRYASVNEAFAILTALAANMAMNMLYLHMIGNHLPYSLHVINFLLLLVLVGGVRFCVRIAHYFRKQREKKKATNVLILGAGDAGAMIAREIQQRYHGDKNLVGFIDDAQYKRNQRLFGVRVLGTRAQLAEIVTSNQVDEIIIAMPSVNGTMLRNVIRDCRETKCNVKIIPGLYELIDGKVSMQELRNVDLEDLLRRDPVRLDLEQIEACLKGKRVFVTGAGGSIGSELCRQIVKMEPDQLILFGKGENSIYEIHQELRGKHPSIAIYPVIGDVRDSSALDTTFSDYRPQVVFHAAAHKHVPLMEAQPAEAVKNNIFGTKNVAEAADRFGSEIFVMISTDKAVNPTSVMGATKRVAELIIQGMNAISQTKFVAVRFGNVLGSRGSVIPLFKKQIAQGGPITITHPDMKRYFMTIPEATQLVLQAGAMAQGGEVFVLDMGEPVNIKDMACDLIELSGLEPHKDIEIKYTGLRPGEKLYEELMTEEEGTSSTRHNKIFIANLKEIEKEKLVSGLQRLKLATSVEKTLEAISELVLTYDGFRRKDS